jgi:parallel beta-helix repeat protein
MSNVRDFGAKGDGKTDDTAALQHCLKDGNGLVEFPRGDYLISQTLVIDLTQRSRVALKGTGGTAKLIMTGPGPALALHAGHTGSADPGTFRPEEWLNERMPTVSEIEIEGRHPEADGILISGVMQPTLTGVLIRRVRNAIEITRRARNVLISHCHIYHNTGIGIYLNQLNLHQINIIGCHISYNRLGGIRTENCEIRNFQITGNDIEYNNNRAIKVPGADDIATAEIYIDVGEGSIREGTISSNTIQATYSKNGSNIRFIGAGGDKNHKAGMWCITGNLIGSQETNIHLTSVRGMSITGNFVYSGHHRNVLIEDSKHITLGANCFEHNPDYQQNELCTGVTFKNCDDCNITGMILQDSQAGKHTVPNVVPIERQGLLELFNCRRFNISGSQIFDAAPHGIYLENCTDTIITGCTVLDNREKKLMRSAIHLKQPVRCLIASCRLGKGSEHVIETDAEVQQSGNLTD